MLQVMRMAQISLTIDHARDHRGMLLRERLRRVWAAILSHLFPTPPTGGARPPVTHPQG